MCRRAARARHQGGHVTHWQAAERLLGLAAIIFLAKVIATIVIDVMR